MGEFKFSTEVKYFNRDLGEAAVRYTCLSHPDLAVHQYPIFFSTVSTDEEISTLTKVQAPFKAWEDELNGTGLEGRVEIITLPLTAKPDKIGEITDNGAG